MATASAIKEAIKSAYRNHETIMLWGPPGIGKTDLVAQAARELAEETGDPDFGLIDWRAALRDPTEVKGFPIPDTKSQTMKFFRDGELPSKGRGLLFMDEIVSGMPATQAAFMQLFLPDHKGVNRIGDYAMPKEWVPIGAGNREGDRGIVHRMPSPTANRMTHLEMEVSVDDWVQWAIGANISPGLIAFIRFREELLFKFDPKIDSRAFPSPRSWVRTEKWTHDKHLSDDTRRSLIKGTTGDGPGAEYIAFLSMAAQLPDIDDIRKHPDKAPLPVQAQPGARYAITTLLGANTKDLSDFKAFMTYMARLEKEFHCVYIRDSVRRNEKLAATPTYRDWALKNADFIV